MRILTIFLISILVFFSSSCQNDKIKKFKNAKYRYKFLYSSELVNIKDKNLSDGNSEFIRSVENSGTIIPSESVDAALFNRNSYPPVYDVISVSTVTKYININNIEKGKTELEYMFSYQLEMNYTGVRLLRSEYQNFKIGKTYRLDYRFFHNNTECFSSIIILTNNPLFSNIITAISTMDREYSVIEERDRIINSFKKY